jgi:adenylate cyclase
MAADEEGTLAHLKAVRAELIDPAIAAHGGRIVKTTGDGLLLDFPSVVAAVRCMVEVQTAMAGRNAEVPPDRRLDFRVGVNLGDVLIEGDDIFGDGVNLAARLQEIAAPGGICLSHAAREQVGERLDTAFQGGGEQVLKNVARPVRVWRWSPAGSAPAALTATEPTSPLPDRPSVAVLPFENLSGDERALLLADALVEDMTALVARMAGFLVISSKSSLAYRNRMQDLRTIGRELGVRYLVTGGLRIANEQALVTAQLADAETGRQIWNRRFEVPRAQLAELQAEVALAVVNELEPELNRAELALIRRRGSDNLDAWACYRQAIGALTLGGWNEEAVEEALSHLARAISLDPGFGVAHALVGLISALAEVFGLRSLDERARADVRRSVEAALAADPDNSEVLGYAGCALSDLGEHRAGLDLVERALEIDPSNAQAWMVRGMCLSGLGRLEEGISDLRRGMRISPRDRRLGMWGNGLAERLLAAGHPAEAVEEARLAVRRDRTLYVACLTEAAALNRLGRSDDARAAVVEACRIRPRLSLAQVRRTHGDRIADELLPLWPSAAPAR